MTGRFAVLAALFACLAVTAAAKPALRNPPYAIGHRGLCGVFPEHTIKAYSAAIAAGADFIECDVVPTKDCKLICRHEPDLSATTNANKKFPKLVRTVNVDGSNMTGVFSFDLTLNQVKTLRARQQNPIRDQSFNGAFEVPTLAEYIRLAQSADRAVGIYPETKHPSFHDSLDLGCWGGKTFTEAVVDELTRFGYTGAVGSKEWRQRPAFLQSFERKNLLSVSSRTKLPLVFLTDEFDLAIPYETTTYGEVLNSKAELKKLHAAGIRGIGPWKNTLVPFTAKNNLNTSTIADGVARVQGLQSAGFQVHIYTLRNEPKRPDGSGSLPWNYMADPNLEYDLFFKRVGVDGAFTDHVHTLARYLGKN